MLEECLTESKETAEVYSAIDKFHQEAGPNAC